MAKRWGRSECLANETRITTIMVGLEPELEQRLTATLGRADVRTIRNADEFMNVLETLTPETVHLLCCGPAIADLPAIELAQSLKSQVPGRALLYMASEKHQADYALLRKNGFDDVFFMPLDGARLEKTLRHKQNELIGEAEANLISVPLEGLVPGTVLDFDVMVLFPLNRKYVKLFHRGMPIRAETLAKLEGQNVKVFFIPESAREKCEAFMRRQTPNGGDTPLARRERLQQEIVALFHGLQVPDQGTFDGGKVLLDKAIRLVSDLLGRTKADRVLSDLIKVTGQQQGDHYDQALRVSMYASLFSLLLGVGKPEDLALAGLFHHVGLARIPEYLVAKPWGLMTLDEQTEYGRHPELALKMVKDQRLVLVPEVQNAIQYHHERPDGSGYPKKLPEAKIPEGAFVLALASAFDDLTTVKEGCARVSAREAAESLRSSGIAPVDMLHKFSSALKAA